MERKRSTASTSVCMGLTLYGWEKEILSKKRNHIELLCRHRTGKELHLVGKNWEEIDALISPHNEHLDVNR